MRKKSFQLGPALLGSIALHAAIVVLLVVEFPREATRLVLSAVPVEIVSQEQHEAAPAPPAPEPTPAPQPEPQPQPQPQPPAPKPPEPKPEPKPQPAPPKPAPKPKPEKPQQQQHQAADDDPTKWAAGLGGSPPKSQTQPQRQPQHRPGQGRDQVSTGPDVDALRGMFGRTWSPNCPTSGADNVQIGVRIHLRYDGTTSGPAEIDNPRPNDPVWVAAANRAAMAAQALHYRDLTPQQLRMLSDPSGIYFKIDQRSACRL